MNNSTTKMNAETLAALKDSIKHWKRLYTGKTTEGERIGPDHCALCKKFMLLKLFSDQVCDGCPVKVFTGKSGCNETPYHVADITFKMYGLHSPEFKAAAKKEYDFLRSLLPKDDK